MINDDLGCIDYDESGAGPTIVLVPGSCSTGTAWRPIISHWGNTFHCVTTSLLGYGRSAERRTALDADISHEDGGAGTFAAWPQRVRDYAVETTAVNVLDWASAYGFHVTRDLLATVEVPTLVLWGGSSHPAVQRANELLGQCIPGASVAIIEGAAHFMIATHARQTAGVIAEHVASIEHANKTAVSLVSCTSRDRRSR